MDILQLIKIQSIITHIFLLVIVIILYMCHYITSNNCTKSGTKICKVISVCGYIGGSNKDRDIYSNKIMQKDDENEPQQK